MATYVNGPRTFLANLAVSAFRGVVISNNGGVTYAGATDIPAGFTFIDGASGDFVPVRTYDSTGTHKAVITAVPVTVGDNLYAGALGRVSTTGTITVGKSLTTATANDSVIEFLPLR